MKIAVIGTGYVGLVTGTCLAETGNNVICVDIDKAKVEKMKNGEVPIYEPGLDVLFHRNIEQGRLSFTTDLAHAVAESQLIFMALPTPPGGDGAADLSYILGAAKDISKLVTEYKVVVSLDERSRCFLVKQGHASTVCQLNMRGMDDALSVISASTDNIEIMHRVLREHAQALGVAVDELRPEQWLDAFFENHKGSGKQPPATTTRRSSLSASA